jgi:hypothetical protein
MLTIEKEIYVTTLNKLVSSQIITQRIADQLTTMLDEKKCVNKAKNHINNLLSLLYSIESFNNLFCVP